MLKSPEKHNLPQQLTMKQRSNRLTSLSLENFRTFKNRQEIPLRPITLIYGQNSAGKSSIIKALNWVKKLAGRSGWAEFDSHVHRHDPDNSILVGYEHDILSFDEAFGPEGQDKRRGIWYEVVKTVESTRIDVEICDCDKFYKAIASMFPVLAADGPFIHDKKGPKIVRTNLIVNDTLFLSIGRVLGIDEKHVLRPTTRTFLNLSNLNVKHPLIQVILSGAKESLATHASISLNQLQMFLDSMKNRGEHFANLSEEEFSSLIENNLEKYNQVSKYLESLREFDLSKIPLDSLESFANDIQFQEETFPPKPILKAIGFDLTVIFYGDEEFGFGYDHSQYLVSDPETIKSDIIESFCNLLRHVVSLVSSPIDMNLSADPIAESIHIPPIRSMPDRPFFLTEEDLRAVGAIDWPLVDEGTFRSVNKWLKSLNRQDTNFQLEVSKDQSYQHYLGKVTSEERLKFLGVRDVSRGVTLQLPDLGVGISQIIPVLLAAYRHQQSLLLIEQPELHLHPALQAELADVFIESSIGRENTSACPNQFIIETHSEHILLRILRRIRETSRGKNGERPGVKPEDIAVLYVDNQGDHSIVHEMPINENGELTRDWPGGFFEEGIREVLL